MTWGLLAFRARFHGCLQRRRDALFELCDVEYLPGAEGNKLAAVARPRLFKSPDWLPQPRLFDLSSTDWLRALRLDGHAPRSPRGPQEALQGVLFPYLDAL